MKLKDRCIGLLFGSIIGLLFSSLLFVAAIGLGSFIIWDIIDMGFLKDPMALRLFLVIAVPFPVVGFFGGEEEE